MLRRGRLRKLFQWQLSSILVLTALIGVALAFYVRWIGPYRAQFNAREKLEALGGRLEAVEAEPAWMVHLVGRRKFHWLVSYRNEASEIGDEDIRPIAALPHLERLYLDRTQVGDRGARYIGRLKNVRRLSLWRTRITNDGLAHIARCTNLRVLDVHSNCITDEGLKSLAPLTELRQLTLGGAVCGPGLESIARLPSLARLDLRRTAVDSASLAFLAGSPVEQLWLESTLPASAAEHLSRLPRLRNFYATLVGADDETARLISQCTDLRYVSLSGIQLTDLATSQLAELSHLQDIRLVGDLTDETIFRLATMEQLTNVSVTGRFSLDALVYLQRALPDASITVKTLLPSSYYANNPGLHLSSNPPQFDPPPVRRLDPLIQVWVANIPRTTSIAERPLRARVYFPGSLRDLAHLDLLHQRLQIVELFYHQSSRTHTEIAAQEAAANGSLSLQGIEQLPDLQVLHIHRAGCRDWKLLAQLPKLRELIIDDRTFTGEDLAALPLPSSLERLTVIAPNVSHERLQELRDRYPSVDITAVTINHRWTSAIGEPPPDSALSLPSQFSMIKIDNARTTIDCDRFATQTDLTWLTITGAPPRKPLWHLSKPLPALQTLRLSHATDRDLAQLQFCPALKILFLDRTSISDDALRHLAHTPQLQRLNLSTYSARRVGPWITGRGFQDLAACRNLDYLDLTCTPIEGKYLADLAPLQKLKELSLPKTNICDEDCQLLARLPALEKLQLSYTKITDDGLRELAKCPKLQTLDVTATQVSDGGLEHLPGCETLRSVIARSTQVTERGVEAFSERFPAIKIRLR